MNQPDIAPSSQPATPASQNEIPGLARIDKIATDPHARAGAAGGSAGPAAAFGDMGKRLPSGTILGDFVGGMLDLVARVLNPTLVERSLTLAKRLGHFAVLAGGALTVLYAIFAAIRMNSFATFATGLGIVVALAVAQFAAMRFLDAADTTINATPSRISAHAFLECVGLLSLLGGLAVLLTGLAGAIAAHSFLPLLPAILFTLGLTYFGAVALHPQMANVSIAPGTAGEEAIGLLSFFFKAGLKLVPLSFALLAIAGDLTVLTSFFGDGQTMAGIAEGVMAFVPLPVRLENGLVGSGVVIVACLVPIGAYFMFLLQYLVIDLVRAVLSVPAKLDALKR
jgi:hypothetical protein